MIIGGFQKFTLIDYPGKIAATVFTLGCNFLCPFCHNPELVDELKMAKQPRISAAEILKFLAARRGLLEGVCVTGGEPTLQADLPSFVWQIKKLGFLVKIDTNGSNPRMLAELLRGGLVDFVAMDIKAPLEKYQKIASGNVVLADIQRSIDLTRQAPDYEFRTTILPFWHTAEDILSVGRWLRGAKKYCLQQFHPTKTLNSSLMSANPFNDEEIAVWRGRLEIFFDSVEARG